MSLLDLCRDYGIALKKHGAGGFSGPCPKCGGTDRFNVWPSEGEFGKFWCRAGCGFSGDSITMLMDQGGLTYPEAAERVGKQLAEIRRRSTVSAPEPRRRPGRGPTPAPLQPEAPEKIWAAKATAFVDHCHAQLLGNMKQLRYLDSRGVGPDLVKRFRIGYNTEDLYRARSSWGVPPAYREDGKEKKLWLPKGIVVPCFSGGTIVRLRIRREEKNKGPRYYWVPGSSTHTFVACDHPGSSPRAVVIIETELDAIMVVPHIDDIAAVVALGTVRMEPRGPAATVVTSADIIVVALDNDEAGTAAWDAEWRDNPAAVRAIPPQGKDPGEAFAAGVDIRAWLLRVLPFRFRRRAVIRKVCIGSAAAQGTNGPDPDLSELQNKEGEAPPRATGKAGNAEEPADVAEVKAILRRHPAVRIIRKADGSVKIHEPQGWGMRHQEDAWRLSNLVFGSPSVMAWVDQTEGGVNEIND